ncbi:hypothetical protein [Duganella violaceipulchra]|uniref:Biopolymer transport protein ExbD n=1 Tax=Duganella violaceipulchra TaxID=2849652 RepID=A0AA41HG13_9BURK|nr:hypothetical protein [Duganella violaceicalia]MBV6324362.1 hypothetical protein [Duganella violaceicalia]MCP2007245.1 biopolymer transport protein ExbD [Duganella violaceicalia]
MQSYVFNLGTGAAAVRAFDVPADLFVYESGVPTPTSGDTRIKVKPNTGAEIVLRPGQRFRLAPGSNATHWEVSTLDPAVTLTGYIIIGSGEFDDANTLNKFTLDATFANNVKVTNTTAERVPVTLDTTQSLGINNTTANRVPVTLDPAQVLNIAGTTVQYTNSFSDSVVTTLTNAVVFSAAANANGAYVEFAEVSAVLTTNGAYTCTLVAKATAPASDVDGDVIMITSAGGQNALGPLTQINDRLGYRVKIPAGKGLWLNQNNGANFGAKKTVLYTLL